MRFYSDLSGKEVIDPIPGVLPNGAVIDVPRRLYINGKKWSFIVTPVWSGRTQGWSPWNGYRGFMGRHWWMIVVHPSVECRCVSGCGRAKGHKGAHR